MALFSSEKYKVELALIPEYIVRGRGRGYGREVGPTAKGGEGGREREREKGSESMGEERKKKMGKSSVSIRKQLDPSDETRGAPEKSVAAKISSISLGFSPRHLGFYS